MIIVLKFNNILLNKKRVKLQYIKFQKIMVIIFYDIKEK